LEAIQNRVIENRKRGKFTWVFLDEVYLYFKYHYSAEILYRAWKRFRKYGGRRLAFRGRNSGRSRTVDGTAVPSLFLRRQAADVEADH
ncbi:MAG: hypothetical protein II724_05775, partial [Clostridia bacterium]|nr:hypothetical protein [Clostridia bacterium]